jgi:tetratricopeptide (TPR) repeat protein
MALLPGADDPRVEDALAAFLRAQDRGEAPDPETWVSSQPAEIRSTLREFLRLMGLLREPPRKGRDVPERLPDFPRYSGLWLVGRGGMGGVYRARDSVLGRVVALKVMHPDLATDPDRVARFLDEAQVASQLQHPNIVPVYDSGFIPGEPRRPFFTMRLVARRTLADSAAEYHALPPGRERDARRDELLRQFVAVCGAVAYAHAKGVLHRDLKPRNVMVGEFREVQVMDWGLSKLLAGPGEEQALVETVRTTGGSESVAGAVRGTPAYMPPEQADGQRLGTAADVFALGGVLCHILTNRPVYDLPTRVDLLLAARACDTGPALARLPADTPAELVALVRRCLAKEPGERPASAELVGKGVADYLASAEQRAREAEVNRARAEEQVRAERTRRRWQLAAVAVGLALVFGGVAAGIWYRADREQRRLQDEARAAEETKKEAERRQEEERQAATRQADVSAAVAEMYAALERDQFAAAAAALQRAKGRLGLDPPADLAARVREAEVNHTVAVNLDQIRQESVVQKMAPGLAKQAGGAAPSDDPTAVRFAQQFALIHCAPALPDSPERIRTSPIRNSLVAALDAWANATRDPAEREMVLACARKADPDPVWRDRFRDPAVRADGKRVFALVQEVGLEKLTVSQLVTALELVGDTVPQAEFTRMLKAIEVRRPSEFWLHITFAGWFAVQKSPDLEKRREALADAVSHARTALALRPDSELARAVLGLLLARTGDAQECELLAGQLEHGGYEGPVKHAFLVIAALKRNDYRKALGHIDRMIALEPKNPQPRVLRVRALVLLAEIRLASEEVEKLAAEFPNLADGWALKAALAIIAGKLDDAERHARHAVQLEPKNGDARIILGTVLFRQGRLFAAEALFRSLEPDDAMRATASLFAAILRAERGDYDEAVRTLDHIERTEPNWEADMVAALVLVNAGRVPEARVAFERFKARVKNNKIDLSPVLGHLSGLKVWTVDIHLRNFERAEEALRGKIPNWPEGGPKGAAAIPLFALQAADWVFVLRCNYVAARYFEFCMPAGSSNGRESYSVIPFGTCRFRAARAAAQAWAGSGRDAFRATDEERTRFRKLALRWVKEEVEAARRAFALKEDLIATNQSLHRLKMHRDLDPIRNPLLIAEMPEEERKLANEIWAGVDELLTKLNPDGAAKN